MGDIVKVVAPAPLPREATFTDLLKKTRDRLANLLKERPDAVIEIGGRYEITRPVALAIKTFLRDTVIAMGGSVKFTVSQPQIIEESQEITVKVGVEIKLPSGQEVVEEALGSCAVGEIGAKNSKNLRSFHDAVATAETRAIKRLIEVVLGEDVVNQLILNSIDPVVVLKEKLKRINEKMTKKGKKPLSPKALVKTAIKNGAKVREVEDFDKLTPEEAWEILYALGSRQG